MLFFFHGFWICENPLLIERVFFYARTRPITFYYAENKFNN